MLLIVLVFAAACAVGWYVLWHLPRRDEFFNGGRGGNAVHLRIDHDAKVLHIEEAGNAQAKSVPFGRTLFTISRDDRHVEERVWRHGSPGRIIGNGNGNATFFPGTDGHFEDVSTRTWSGCRVWISLIDMERRVNEGMATHKEYWTAGQKLLAGGGEDVSEFMCDDSHTWLLRRWIKCHACLLANEAAMRKAFTAKVDERLAGCRAMARADGNDIAIEAYNVSPDFFIQYLAMDGNGTCFLVTPVRDVRQPEPRMLTFGKIGFERVDARGNILYVRPTEGVDVQVALTSEQIARLHKMRRGAGGRRS